MSFDLSQLHKLDRAVIRGTYRLLRDCGLDPWIARAICIDLLEIGSRGATTTNERITR